MVLTASGASVGTAFAMHRASTTHLASERNTGRDEDPDPTKRRPEMSTKEMTKAIALLSISCMWVFWAMYRLEAMTHLG